MFREAFRELISCVIVAKTEKKWKLKKTERENAERRMGMPDRSGFEDAMGKVGAEKNVQCENCFENVCRWRRANKIGNGIASKQK